MKSKEYKIVKNYIVNEFGISKELIKKWTLTSTLKLRKKTK